MNEPKKILIVRFSSFGDIIQCMSVVLPLKRRFPNAQIDWVTKTEFSELLKISSEISKIHLFDKRDGMLGLFRIAQRIRKENYDLVYDAHSNLRSFLLRVFLMGGSRATWVMRHKKRLKRILLFKFRINLFPKPFRGMISYLAPLKKFNVVQELFHLNPKFSYECTEKILKLHLPDGFITLVPSAAWAMKRWPLEYWKKMITLRPHDYFVVLGGPLDDFCDELAKLAPNRVKNLAGELSLIQSAHLISKSKMVISADTGLLHVADLFGKKAIALIGPTAFGFTTGKTVTTVEVSLPCRPCTKDGRGSCSQPTYQRCMVEITPDLVDAEITKLLS